MKRLILVLCLVFVYQNCFASSASVIRRGGAAACSTPTNGDVWNEGFIGTGYETTVCGSAECIAETGTVDEDHTLSGAPPSGSCSEGARVNASNSIDYLEFRDDATIDIDTIELDFCAEIYINEVTLTDVTAATIMNIGLTQGAPGTTIARLEIFNNSGTYEMRGKATTTSTRAAFTLDKWLTVCVHVDSVLAESYWTLDDGTTCDVADECGFTRAEADSQYYTIGAAVGVGSGETLDMEIGRVWINTP